VHCIGSHDHDEYSYHMPHAILHQEPSNTPQICLDYSYKQYKEYEYQLGHYIT
jgi:hypothetical protein